LSERATLCKMPSVPKLVQVYPDDTHHEFALTRDTILGRGDDCTIRLDRKSVSRHHARIYATPAGGWEVEDMQSTNGTYLNDIPIASCTLQDADQLKLGAVVLRFVDDL
jgi:pSer/pThr/pTyr-binding forkhead associated (FHA) protein